MKVALYARVSSDQQAEKNNSIPSQLRLLHEYALKYNMEVVREYIDEGESALSINRPAFLDMIAETKKHFQLFKQSWYGNSQGLPETGRIAFCISLYSGKGELKLCLYQSRLIILLKDN